LRLQDLAAYPLAGTHLPASVAAAIRALSGCEQPLGVECDNFMVLKALVAKSEVLSMAPWDVVAEDVEAGRLALLQLPAGEPSQQSAYGLVSRAERSLSPAARAMLEYVQAEDALFAPARR